jgi:hypothetical protein
MRVALVEMAAERCELSRPARQHVRREREPAVARMAARQARGIDRHSAQTHLDAIQPGERELSRLEVEGATVIAE